MSAYEDDSLEAFCVPMRTDPVKYWKDNQKFPFLSMVAKDVISVPASPAPIDRLFSIAIKVFSPERHRLNDRKFKLLMFLHCNS